MKIKKILIISICIIMVFSIYTMTIDRKIFYISLGDSLAVGQNPYGQIDYGYSDYVATYLKKNNLLEFYTKNFSHSGYRTTDLLRDINDNVSIQTEKNNLTIKNALLNADLVTISIGANDFFYKLNLREISDAYDELPEVYPYIDEIMVDMESLFTYIRKYCKEDIFIIGYYNPVPYLSEEVNSQLEPVFTYANDRLKNMASKYQMDFIDTYNVFVNNSSYLPNPLDIHPGMKGYEEISTKIIDKIEEKIID